MGWLYVQRSPGTTHREFFKQQFACDDQRRVLDVAAPRWDEAYVAYQTSQGVLCIGVMIHRCPKSLFNFGYKDMDESMGPLLYHCPERILRLLSPTAELFAESAEALSAARNWRAQQPKFEPEIHNL